ncbi:hypothetical protein GCM10007977_025260 [Dactylosporangium sucinum]|uniref:Uncharacterized protein n=1 Tax=Dactylosporangium sucinum TaxID=1424081 RepID=A0A917THE4_9ACTN|nr:hypothetical protein GCM10007977_025260 [Dactylosporangium sucinum]
MPAGLDWARHGFQPRWLGMETSDCAVAIEPGHFSGRGDDERDRFLAASARRGELALVISVIGDVDDDGPRRVLSRFDASVQVGDIFTSVAGRRLPAGSRPTIAPDLGAADRDLAIRLLTRPPDAPWWTLDLHGATLSGSNGQIHHPPEGQLEPILVDALGDPVVAAWVPPAGDQRWYVIPDATPWDNLLGWLIHSALPAYAPAVLRRARSPHFIDPDLQTGDELAARLALTELKARYAEEKTLLEQQLRAAEQRAEPVRYGLLYGSGDDLVAAVAAVCTAAGLHTVALDQDLGGTKSADLLVSAGDAPPRQLVEIKAVGGAAQESLVGHLQRHLDTWPQLRPDLPVTGGVLVVNHQHKLPPAERPAQVYTRPEFVASLPVTVLSSMELFGWWRAGDWPAIRSAILGAEPTAAPVPPQSPTASHPGQAPPDPSRSWWRRRRSGTATA